MPNANAIGDSNDSHVHRKGSKQGSVPQGTIFALIVQWGLPLEHMNLKRTSIRHFPASMSGKNQMWSMCLASQVEKPEALASEARMGVDVQTDDLIAKSRGSKGCWWWERLFDHQESLSPAVLNLALIGIHPPVEGSGKHVMGCDCMLLLFFLFNHIFFMAMIILTSIWSLVLLLLRFWDGSHRKVDEHLGCCCWFLPYWWDKMICIIPVTWMGKSLDPVMKSVSVMLSPRPHLKRRNGDEAMDYL